MEDMRHLEVLEAMTKELLDTITEFNRLRSGITDRARLLDIYFGQAEALETLLAKHNRTLCFMAGLPYDPQVHFAEAVLEGVGGGGANS